MQTVRPPDEQTGTFEQIPLSHLLIRALDNRWNGSLIVHPNDTVKAIQLDRGLVSRVLVPDEFALFGALLVEAGVVMQAELDLALGKPGLLGETLISQGLLDTTTLQRVLVLQCLRRLERLFALASQTTWVFSEDLSVFDGMPSTVRVDTLRVLWAGLQAHGEVEGKLEATLARIGDSSFRVVPEVRLSRFGFTGDALAAASFLRGERLTLMEFVAEEIAPPEVCQQIVYLLAITRYLEFGPVGVDDECSTPISSRVNEGGSKQAPELDHPSRQRVARIKLRRVAIPRAAAPDLPGAGEQQEPASKRDPLLPEAGEIGQPTDDGLDTLPSAHVWEQAREEVIARVAKLSEETPLTLLGIAAEDLAHLDEAEVTDVLWLAYEKVSRRWHPDSCPRELSGLRESLGTIHDAISEAFVALADPRQRATHMVSSEPARNEASAPDGGSDQTPVSRMSSAELHERALYEHSEKRPSEALQLCNRACEMDPSNPDYQATAIWIRASMSRPDLKVLTLDLDDILRTHRDHVLARYYRGVLRRRIGYDSAAKRDFEYVLGNDPNHAAARAQLAELQQAFGKAGR